jgi:hypothetical protein
MSTDIYPQNNIYYVYVYIDPRNNTPFYVGKGCSNRYKRHLLETSESTDNRRKYNKIRKLISLDLQPIIKFEMINVDEETAYNEEERLIKFYGRKDIDEYGILTNICVSNKPPNHTGYTRSIETRKKMSEKQKGNTKGRSNLGKRRSPETKRLLSIILKGRKSYVRTPEIIENYNIAQKAYRRATETKFNLVNCDRSIVEYNISAKDFCEKYSSKEIKFDPSNFRRNIKTGSTYKGWSNF